MACYTQLRCPKYSYLLQTQNFVPGYSNFISTIELSLRPSLGLKLGLSSGALLPGPQLRTRSSSALSLRRDHSFEVSALFLRRV